MTVPRGTRGAPRPIGETLQEMLAAMKPWTCGKCGDTYHAREQGDGICNPCGTAIVFDRAREEEGKALLANLGPRLFEHFRRCGLGRRELGASIPLIPKALMAMLERPETAATLHDLLDGGLPERGFGLNGDVGVGKTMALSALFMKNTEQAWVKGAKQLGSRVATQRFAWVRWPEVVSMWRTRTMRDGGLEDVEQAVSKLKDIPMLVLDDLGGERMKGSYTDDFCASQLDLIIDHRYGEMLPTWYTSNLTGTEFLERYGSRMFSRIAGANTIVKVPDGPDLRIVKGGR